MLRHPQTARRFGVAACAVVVGSQAAYHRQNITLNTTTRPVSGTLIHVRPAPRYTPLLMPFHLRSVIPDHTHQKCIRVRLDPIRDSLGIAFWIKASLKN